MPRNQWTTVSARRPCQKCLKPDWCAYVPDDDSVLICRRIDDGTGRYKIDGEGFDYWVYGEGAAPVQREYLAPVHYPNPELHDRAYRILLDALTLSPHHRSLLQARGLDNVAIEKGGYKSLEVVGRKALAERVEQLVPEILSVPGFYIKRDGDQQWLTLAGAAGIVIPCLSVHGRVSALKIRSDDSTHTNRYTYVSSLKYDGPGPGTPVHVPLWEGSTELIRVTEGELKANVSTHLSGILTISAPGITGWRTTIPALHFLKAKQVKLAFDSEPDNPQVQRATRFAMEGMKQAGFEVELESWDPKEGKGIDDVLLTRLTTAPKDATVGAPCPF